MYVYSPDDYKQQAVKLYENSKLTVLKFRTDEQVHMKKFLTLNREMMVRMQNLQPRTTVTNSAATGSTGKATGSVTATVLNTAKKGRGKRGKKL